MRGFRIHLIERAQLIDLGGRMLVGAHVSSAGGPLQALSRAEEMGAQVMQFHIGSPRVWKTPDFGEALFETYRSRAASSPVKASICHASYLVNLATANAALLERSGRCLVENLWVATALGTAGLVLHLGSHGGAGLERRLTQVSDELLRAMDAVAEVGRHVGRQGTARVLLENAAGSGDTVGRSFEDLGKVIDAAGGDERIGVCLDTQHLFASGVAFGSLGEADRLIEGIESAVGPSRLGCVHLNDSAVSFGSNRDRHANLGKGRIGTKALGSLISHPALAGLPAVLEVPGPDGHGPRREDLEDARSILSSGRRRRARMASRTGRNGSARSKAQASGGPNEAPVHGHSFDPA